VRWKEAETMRGTNEAGAVFVDQNDCD